MILRGFRQLFNDCSQFTPQAFVESSTSRRAPISSTVRETAAGDSQPVARPHIGKERRPCINSPAALPFASCTARSVTLAAMIETRLAENRDPDRTGHADSDLNRAIARINQSRRDRFSSKISPEHPGGSSPRAHVQQDFQNGFSCCPGSRRPRPFVIIRHADSLVIERKMRLAVYTDERNRQAAYESENAKEWF